MADNEKGRCGCNGPLPIYFKSYILIVRYYCYTALYHIAYLHVHLGT